MALTAVGRRHMAEAVAVTLVTAHNWLSNRRIPAAWYVPANVGVAAGMVALGRWGGGSWTELGLGRDQLWRGLVTGAAVGGAASGVVVTAAIAPRTLRWFADDRALLLTRRAAAYEALVRIPLGTALGEELAFRSVLLGLSLRHRSWPASVAVTSALFGLWHILPTIDTLPKHLIGRAAISDGRSRHAVTLAVGTTAVAGAGLAALRLFSGSVTAPIVVHAAANVTALLASRARGAGVYTEASALTR